MTFRNVSLLMVFAAVNAGAQTAGNWTQMAPLTSPSARSGTAMAYDSVHGQTVLFGGYNGGYLNDTWVWDGSNWTQKSPANSPPVRSGHTMVYDSAHSQVVLFGGLGGSFDYLNDTWVWDGSNWTQKLPQASPSVRYLHTMAYDSAHGQAVVYGGYGTASGVFLNDTWVWDGSNWTQKSPQISPPTRDRSVMAYDSAHGQAVLFGGYSSGLNSLNDTWVWDGSNWTQKTPPNSPPARANSAMAYDSAHGQSVLFGGENQNLSNLNDTWTWDGSNWTQQSPQTSPPVRAFHSMAYDPAHGQTVLFGGYIGTYLNDTWAWGTGSEPAIAAVISLSGFGGLSTVAPGSWVEIYGSNLAATSRLWTGADFSGNNAPTSLDGVGVTIGGQKAFVEYISPGQIDVQTPSSIATGGPLPVVVTNGYSSAPFNVTVNVAAPGLLATAPFQISGKQYAVALLADGVTYVLPAGAIPGVASRPAKPGEPIVLYGIGFGTVVPNSPAGQIVTQSNQIAQSFQISFGGVPAVFNYDGLEAPYIGLYQFNVTVPAVADNNLVPLTFSLGGVPGAQTLYIAVHQ